MKYESIPLPLPMLMLPDSKDKEAFRCGALVVLKSIDDTPRWGWLKHISISTNFRYPTWDELLACKEHFFGDIDCMMVMPKREDYVNIHRFTFHIWQCPEQWGIR